jgi:hypothetical protein
MSVVSIVASLLTLAAPQAQPAAQGATQAGAAWKESLLAKIPDGLEVQNDLLHRSNRGAFASRSTLVWSADGRTVAYAGVHEGEWHPVIGAKVGATYDYVSMPVLAGGRAFFHVGKRKTSSTEQHWLWIDGKTVGPEDWMGDIGVSSDGKHAAYWTWPGAKVGNGEPATSREHFFTIASEGKNAHWGTALNQKSLFEQALVAPIFNEDGSRAFTCGVTAQGWVVLQTMANMQDELCVPAPLIDAIATSKNGAMLAYVKTDALTEVSQPIPTAAENAELYFRGKRVGKSFAGITQPTVDARGEHVAYAVTLDGKRAVAIDDEKAPEGRYDFIEELAFDPDGRQLAFVANLGGKPNTRVPGAFEGGETFVVVRSVPQTPAKGAHAPPPSPPAPMEAAPHFLDVRDLAWDSKGERFAYCARDDSGWRVVCGKLRSPPHTLVGPPRFGADGSSIGFGSRDGAELWWRVLANE